jgi:hypothetical protein
VIECSPSGPPVERAAKGNDPGGDKPRNVAAAKQRAKSPGGPAAAVTATADHKMPRQPSSSAERPALGRDHRAFALSVRGREGLRARSMRMQHALDESQRLPALAHVDSDPNSSDFAQATAWTTEPLLPQVRRPARRRLRCECGKISAGTF